MAAAEATQAQWTIPSIIDIAAKTVTVVGAAGLILGVTFNISFFLLTRPDWLFHLTIADNLTATFYALPFVLLAAVGMAVFIGGPTLVNKWFRERGDFGSRRHRWASGITFFLTYFAFSMSMSLTLGPFAQSLILALTIIIVATAPFLKAAIPTRIAAFTGAGLSFLVVCTVVVAMNARDAVPHRTADVEVGDRIGSSILRGNIVRGLDSGVILSQQDQWVWIPKERILQIREPPADKKL